MMNLLSDFQVSIYTASATAFIISSILCLILILVIGVSHGSLDHIKGKKLLKLFNIKSTYIFYITYILIAVIVILTWIILPSITVSESN